uniref:Protein SZT2 n=1 Tax=Ciona savignyi TaxID=51511 RepID=H2YI44_CIOSA
SIEVHLKYLWWKNPTLVEYKASSTWPLSRNPTKVEVFVTSTYQFLHDASKRNQPNNWSLPRRHLLRRFSRYLQDLLQADHMLYHLQSFSHDPVRYTISDVLKQGQSLFYLPSNSPEFVLSTQAEHVPSVFTSYWKPILSLDVSIWQKWLHIHRIELILKHDSPLPKFASAGQYNSVQSCVAFTQLTMMLRKWCSFVLMENHTYVRFVYEEDNIETPASFFLVRLSSKSPALVLKLAFQFGVSGQIRKKLVTDLQEQVSNLGTPSSSSTKRSRHPTSRSPGSKSQRSHFSSAENCSVLMHKPVDQILVRHQHLPRDYLKITPVFDSQQRPHEHAIRMRDVQWYLRHKRYVWSLTNTVATPLLMDVAESLSKLLVKLRLAEGYHIAHSTSGIVNLTREFPMISSSCERTRSVDVNNFCLVQYVLFPAVVRSSETSLSGEDSEDELEETNNTKEIILAVEIWVEPQDGFIRQSSNNRDALPYYENLTYKEVAKAIIQNDTMCISNIVTLEHFQLMCTNPE